MIKKLISGGQTGVDRAALDAAIELGIPIGGWCPKGRKAEDGRIDDKYPLIETYEDDYPTRTKMNIIEADATLVISKTLQEQNESGTSLTIRNCLLRGKPYLGIALDTPDPTYNIPAARKFLELFTVLNVAGPRESKSPGIYEAAKKFLMEILK